LIEIGVELRENEVKQIFYKFINWK